ncbi:MAG: formate dehydrogenase subunit gamma [Gammaproteobacteria bacterium]|nr:formate dehydrogenase subunit gamma [Gammaproteobacteria bacterium]MBI5619205.1 formate dehydrogenase subunit gamma [Gammaproteobacteria bacterium]
MALAPASDRPAWDAVAARDLVESLAGIPGPLMPVLHALQDRYGYVPDEAVPIVAETLTLSRAEVHGVISFYHYFRQTPPGRATIQICRAEACQAMHVEKLVDHAKRTLGIDFHETTGDGRISLEPVYCLGNCACGPSVMVDGELHARVTVETFDEIVAGART